MSENILTKPVFEPLPPKPAKKVGGVGGSRVRTWGPVLGVVVQSPGKWARIAEYESQTAASTCASALRRGRFPTIPDGDWQFTHRGTRVYACYGSAS